MKKANIIILLTTLLLIGFTACKKDNNPPTERFMINKEKEKVTATTTSVSITGEYVYDGKVKSMFLQLGTEEHLFGSNEYEAVLHDKAYSVTASDLTPGTLYYYRYIVDYGDDIDFESDIYQFTTQSEAPTVRTLEVLATDSTSVRVKCEVLSGGGLEVTERGICWSTSPSPTTSNSHANSGTGTGTYTVNMTNLTINTIYYVRAYAINGAGTAYGSEVSFTTSDIPSYTIAVSANPTSCGSVGGGGTYQQGQSCTVTASANTGYTFLKWTENGMQVSNNASYTFTVSSSRTLVAQFQAQSYTISVSVNPIDGGTVSGGGQYLQGQTCTLTAANNSSFTFDHWTRNGTTISGGATISFTVTSNATYVAHFISNIGGHEYVDLGLPSGLLWATCNVGADSPEDYGDYFAWGETEPKSFYDWSTYQYSEDDAATANWGNNWRMPTYEEWLELYLNTPHTWTTQNGVNGRLFTASNGNSIFLPAAGIRSESYLTNAGSYGYYWSSSLDAGDSNSAWLFMFSSGSYSVSKNSRIFGFSVRPVRVESQN